MNNDAKQWALMQFDEMTVLEQDWDSYGADPISPVAIETASKLLQSVEKQCGNEAYEKLMIVAPRPDGGVQIEWKTWPLEIDVHTDHQGNLGYLYITYHQSDTTKYDEVSSASWDEVLALINKVVKTNEDKPS